jgi:hypothetical protein
MQRLLLAAALIFAITPVSRAQDQAAVSSAEQNPAAGLMSPSIPNSTFSQQRSWLIAEGQPLGPSPISFSDFNFVDFRSATLARPADLAATSAVANWSLSSTAGPSPAADPSPQRGSTYSDEPHRFEISIGVAIVRFRSAVYSATAVGLNTSAAYYWKDWLAIEGNVVPAFAPTIYQNEHIKYLGYAGGAKVVFGHSGLVPWVHGLVGGAHILPQTGLGGKSAFQIQTGGGADYEFNPRISARIGADYVFTHFFGESQNNFQAYAGFVYRF